jgi:prepilin-type N-terminal cleavage/methylation domain-containing protein
MCQLNIKNAQRHDAGFTLTELLCVITAIVIFAGAAIFSFYVLTKQAYNIMAKYELDNFVQAEKAYFAAHNEYLGTTGDFIEDYITDLFDRPDFKFTPATGVRIDIISGNESVKKSPLQIKAIHRNGNTIYIYDFSTGKITERTKK